ncbi:hypothetical protein JXB41_02610 [Candidatus Woesearchaeota archaeon]|nr:hypothetical protein [Candidatus Woesearchaeota archaeon]
MNKKLLFYLFILIAVLQLAYAFEPQQIISNSADWQDVYSTLLYGKLQGKPSYFLVSSRHSTLLISQLPKTEKRIWVINSKKNPYIIGYKGILESQGFEVEEFSYDNSNLELAKKLEGITKFIIIDDSYGYNAISVAPYAVLNNAYVLFANRRNINLIYSFLESVKVDELLVYGQVDREVKTRLEEFNPEFISLGDRFLNNQALVDKYQELHKKINGEIKTQVILTNGEFIEQEIMSGVEPVVFIGRDNVPDQVREYVRNSGIEIGILIGNELIGTATFIRRQLGISVFVKFAQSARSPTGPISAVEDLDRFYLPRYILGLDVYEVSYNKPGEQLFVTYQNLVALSSFLKGTITLRYGAETQTIGDVDPIFIDKNEYKTIVYDVDPVTANEITAEIFTIFGESPKSLEYTLRKTVDVGTVSILDNSEIDILRVMYDKRKGQFLIEIKNTGEVDVFVDLELYDLLINDQLETYGPGEVTFIRKGEKKIIAVDVPMTDEDIENNPVVKIHAYYGERKRSLVKVYSWEGPYSLTGFGYMAGQVIKDIGEGAITYGPILIIILLLLLILGMKKKCPDCGEINPLRAKKCRKCGKKI